MKDKDMDESANLWHSYKIIGKYANEIWIISEI